MSVTAAIEANEQAIGTEAGNAHCPVLDLFRNATPVEPRLAVSTA
ncbi:hypothetical protein [Solirubrobacter deserti]|uniref:Uncharacterized protein n=1 Tax=Solirubrobacter deserti TaxID=2282478 RepID=A0ABT4RCI6_9ACTN|nr:hypothetical protein [Solirubrobacter deserti]MDA0136228.1 hypothetical protein [Solirubrobacter deserti]